MTKNKIQAKKYIEIFKNILRQTANLEFHVGYEKGPRIKKLSKEAGEFLGISMVIVKNKIWKIIPSSSSISKQKHKIIESLQDTQDEPIINLISRLNKSLMSWYGYYRYGCLCQKRDMKPILAKHRELFEAKVNGILKKNGIINKNLSSNKLEKLGVLTPRISFK